jgi:hypothetical protein
VSDWTDPGWRAGADAWIAEQLARLGLESAGAFDQVHDRPWSTVILVPTTSGNVFFKAVSPPLRHEAALTDLLGALDGRIAYLDKVLAALNEHKQTWLNGSTVVMLPNMVPNDGQEPRDTDVVQEMLRALTTAKWCITALHSGLSVERRDD